MGTPGGGPGAGIHFPCLGKHLMLGVFFFNATPRGIWQEEWGFSIAILLVYRGVHDFSAGDATFHSQRICLESWKGSLLKGPDFWEVIYHLL